MLIQRQAESVPICAEIIEWLFDICANPESKVEIAIAFRRVVSRSAARVQDAICE